MHVPLRLVNRSLLAIIVVINVYVIVAPFVPGMVFWVQRHHGGKFTNLATVVHSERVPVVTYNRLIAPAMLFDQPVFEGKTMATLVKGPWRIPYSSTPDKGSNTVIVGHRFTYTNPRGAFYSLDKLKRGDEIALFWNGKEYLFTVRETKTVPPTATEIEAPTTTPILTLYTCTPLWNPKDRLVVIADLAPASPAKPNREGGA